jgi:hypothetical protein
VAPKGFGTSLNIFETSPKYCEITLEYYGVVSKICEITPELFGVLPTNSVITPNIFGTAPEMCGPGLKWFGTPSTQCDAPSNLSITALDFCKLKPISLGYLSKNFSVKPSKYKTQKYLFVLRLNNKPITIGGIYDF